jgi:hypothetical protein
MVATTRFVSGSIRWRTSPPWSKRPVTQTEPSENGMDAGPVQTCRERRYGRSPAAPWRGAEHALEAALLEP